jgi:hypothetical protein
LVYIEIIIGHAAAVFRKNKPIYIWKETIFEKEATELTRSKAYAMVRQTMVRDNITN